MIAKTAASLPLWRRWLSWLSGTAARAPGQDRPRRRRQLLAYDAAGNGTHRALWAPTNASASTEVAGGANRSRARARDLVRNNPYARRALQLLVDDLVGTGIHPQLQLGDSEQAQEREQHVMALWRRWSKECDAGGRKPLQAIVALAVRAWLESGEVLVRRRPRRPSDGLTVPLQLELLEADQLDEVKTETTGRGGRIVNGVEFDRIGRLIGYWVLPAHPGDDLAAPGTKLWQSTFVPRRAIAHVYYEERPGQCRGISHFAAVATTLRDVDDYRLAERIRAKMGSALFAIVTTDDDPALFEGAKDSTGASVRAADGETVLEDVAPGMIAIAHHGKQVQINQPTANPGYTAALGVDLQAAAIGTGLVEWQLTGNLKGVNYSSSRSGLIPYRKMIRRLRRHVIEPLLCDQVWRWFIEAAQAAGELSVDPKLLDVTWSEPAFESVDPLKDATAAEKRMRNGLTHLGQELAMEGKSLESQVQGINKSNKLLDKHGIVLDSDPRHRYRGGFEEPQQPASADEGDKEDKGDDESE